VSKFDTADCLRYDTVSWVLLTFRTARHGVSSEQSASGCTLNTGCGRNNYHIIHILPFKNVGVISTAPCTRNSTLKLAQIRLWKNKWRQNSVQILSSTHTHTHTRVNPQSNRPGNRKSVPFGVDVFGETKLQSNPGTLQAVAKLSYRMSCRSSD
jgi:hypothetical protein